MADTGDQPPQQDYPQYPPQPGPPAGYPQAEYPQAGYPQFPAQPGYPQYQAQPGYPQSGYPAYPPGGGYRPPGWQPRRRGGLATASLVLGIIGFILAVIPFANFVAYPLVVLAIIFGLLAIGWGRAKAGLILGSLGLLATIAWTIGIAVFFNDATGKPHTVVYSVTGSIGQADIDYYTENAGGRDSQQSRDSAPLPFSRTVKVKGDFSDFDLTANAHFGASNSPSGSLTCSITVDGKVVSHESDSGQAPVVSCNANGFQGN